MYLQYQRLSFYIFKEIYDTIYGALGNAAQPKHFELFFIFKFFIQKSKILRGWDIALLLNCLTLNRVCHFVKVCKLISQSSSFNTTLN